MPLPYLRCKIKNGQKDFKFVGDLPDPEDYGIITMPNWDTTVFQIEKSNKGFTLGFGTPCPNDNGWLELTLFTPPEAQVVIQEVKVKSPKEPKMKMQTKKMSYT